MTSNIKRKLLPDLYAAQIEEAIKILASSDMSEVEVAERILEQRGIIKSIADSIAKYKDPKCPYCKEPMTRGDGSFWCMNKRCAEQFYPSGNDEAPAPESHKESNDE